MTNFLKGSGLLILAFVIILINLSTYTIHETEQAIVLRFGEAVKVESKPGLKLKVPFIDKPIKLDRRNLEYDLANPLDITAANEERLVVDAFVRYRINEPLQYYQRLSQGSAQTDVMRGNANNRLQQVLEESLREALGEVQIREIITTRRAELMRNIQAATSAEAKKLGIDIVDVKIRRADFPEQNAQNVYERMKSDYKQQAEKTRAEGDEQARKISAQAEKDRTEILAKANEESQKIRGVADGQRNALFNAAYNKDPEFFAFYRSLQAYDKALKEGETTIILSPDSEFFRYFNDVKGQ